MKCDQIAELLPDFLRGSLEREPAETVERHLNECAECRDEVAVWEKLALLPAVAPSPDARVRFESMLRAYRAGRTEPQASRYAELQLGRRRAGVQWFRSPLLQMAAGIALVAIGFAIGNGLSRTRSQSDEMTAMRAQLTSMRQLVVLSMLQEQSASERLQAVSYSQHEERLDPQVLGALLHTLRYDSSVDVRLAALDALSQHSGQPQVRTGVTDALQAQQSPLVQVALIDQLLEWRDPDAVQRLRNFQQSPNLNPTVRQRAEWALSKLQ
ncbi:MAG TPA: zf-HC2 domain-containing protein [Candidatus Acidoferrum sp.]|nr:zf-HC2 domain-containing protein [Candidatus Acidoferrum sp.]